MSYFRTPKSQAILLAFITLACLAPFSGKAFHMDDPLFVWSAQRIPKHPLDPYGFQLIWYTTAMPMWDVTKNPPLAAYYAALAGAFVGWSEVALHLAFLLPALVVVVGVYQLAREFTGFPLLAAALTLFSPGFMISATSVMSDVLMLALWIAAMIFWRRGLVKESSSLLCAAALLASLCALTKYFGVCLIPLLFLDGVMRKRRVGAWALYLLMPVAVMAGYQLWTGHLYGRGLLTDAAHYANRSRRYMTASLVTKSIVGLSFTGGCIMPAAVLAPLVWRRKWIVGAIAAALTCAVALALGWTVCNFPPSSHRISLAIHLTAFVVAGIFALALAAGDLWRHRSADALLLTCWLGGTFVFTAYVNWTVNARSILPMIPAFAILLGRRMEDVGAIAQFRSWKWMTALALSSALTLWLTWADAGLANSARAAAEMIHEKTSGEAGPVFFAGHWGFQYYMESYGMHPLDEKKGILPSSAIVVVPENNIDLASLPAGLAVSGELIVENPRWVSLVNKELGANFYSSQSWGPLPLAFGNTRPERYFFFRHSESRHGSSGMRHN